MHPNSMFKQNDNYINKRTYNLLRAVVEGDPEMLSALIKDHADHLLTKGNIKDRAGRVFNDVSPYQLMLFLFDCDMLERILPHMGSDANLINTMHEQYNEMQGGGADLVKIDRDPTLTTFEKSQILEHKREYGRIVGVQRLITFPLMENPDAILYYKDSDGIAHWYYANTANQEVEVTEIFPHNLEGVDSEKWRTFAASMDAMPDISARRSNNAEHQFIERILNKKLVRKGIQYKQDGILFCDTHHDFNRYYRAYQEAIDGLKKRDDEKRKNAFCVKLGNAQKEVMWIIQRLCERRTACTHSFNMPLQRDTPRVCTLYNHKFSQPVYDESSESFVEGLGVTAFISKVFNMTEGTLHTDPLRAVNSPFQDFPFM